MQTICFTAAEMEAFASASGDRNPVHLGAAAGATGGGFEAPVVYGALTVLRALAALPAQRHMALRMLDASFHRPLFADNEYQLEVVDRDSLAPAIAISDSGLLAVAVKLFFAAGEPSRAQAALRALRYVSWIAGMRLPGPGALITGLHIAFAAGVADRPGALTYRAAVVEREPGLGEVTVAGVLADRVGQVAAFTFQARPPGGGSRAPRFDRRDCRALERRLPASSALAGRVAVVVGASRGLGAAIACGLALQGCNVYTCSRGGAEFAAGGPRDGAGHPLAIEHSSGDGSDPEFNRRLLARVLDAHGSVDLLVCCAAPRLEPIGFGPSSMARFNAFVHRGFDLLSVPLATFLEAVQARAGCCLLISSAALRTLPRDWGHYVAAKAAGEALAVWAAGRFPEVEMVVARVPRLLDLREHAHESAMPDEQGKATGAGQTRGEENAVTLAEAAARLVGRLAERQGPGVHLVEW